MFYDPNRNSHGLPHNPYKSIIVPRPIGWISTVSREGVVNLAPYSYFNAVSDTPPMVMFCPGGAPERPRKDSRINAEETGEFVVNIATEALREQMSQTAATLPPDRDELTEAGLTPAPCCIVTPPRVAESPVSLECKHHQTVVLPADGPKATNAIVIGHVVGIHISDDILTDGMVDMAKFRPVARLGYWQYTVVDNSFWMTPPP